MVSENYAIKSDILSNKTSVTRPLLDSKRSVSQLMPGQELCQPNNIQPTSIGAQNGDVLFNDNSMAIESFLSKNDSVNIFAGNDTTNGQFQLPMSLKASYDQRLINEKEAKSDNMTLDTDDTIQK